MTASMLLLKTITFTACIFSTFGHTLNANLRGIAVVEAGVTAATAWDCVPGGTATTSATKCCSGSATTNKFHDRMNRYTCTEPAKYDGCTPNYKSCRLASDQKCCSENCYAGMCMPKKNGIQDDHDMSIEDGPMTTGTPPVNPIMANI